MIINADAFFQDFATDAVFVPAYGQEPRNLRAIFENTRGKYDESAPRVRVATHAVPDLSRSSTFEIGGEIYGVVDFYDEAGVTDVILGASL